MTVTTQSLLVVRQGLVPVERNAQPSTAGRRNERERERERERESTRAAQVDRISQRMR